MIVDDDIMAICILAHPDQALTLEGAFGDGFQVVLNVYIPSGQIYVISLDANQEPILTVLMAPSESAN